MSEYRILKSKTKNLECDNLLSLPAGCMRGQVSPPGINSRQKQSGDESPHSKLKIHRRRKLRLHAPSWSRIEQKIISVFSLATGYWLLATPKYLAALLATLAFLAGASPSDARTKSPFTPVGVRPQGMGNAFVAIADDVNSIYWNPAGIARIDTRQIMVAHDDLYGFGIDENYIGYAQKQFGFSWKHTGAGSEFLFGADWSEDAYTLAYAYQVDPKTYAGISLKYLKQGFQIASSSLPVGFTGTKQNVDADGTGLDVGIIYIVDEATTVGLAVRDLLGTSEAQNVAGDLKDHYEPTYTVGFSRHANDMSLFSVQVTHALDEYRVQLGIEYKLQEEIKLRLGLDDEIITAGVGLYHQDWEFDYAFKNKVGQGLDKTQLFGATVKF